ncbi:hypothetical protein BLA29_010797, partial [Euroglyphus maynei]
MRNQNNKNNHRLRSLNLLIKKSADDLARKLELKRERNRIAARKCRNKKLQQIEEYRKNIAILQKDIEKSEAELR